MFQLTRKLLNRQYWSGSYSERGTQWDQAILPIQILKQAWSSLTSLFTDLYGSHLATSPLLIHLTVITTEHLRDKRECM